MPKKTSKGKKTSKVKVKKKKKLKVVVKPKKPAKIVVKKKSKKQGKGNKKPLQVRLPTKYELDDKIDKKYKEYQRELRRVLDCAPSDLVCKQEGKTKLDRLEGSINKLLGIYVKKGTSPPAKFRRKWFGTGAR